jgi:hypothetical protein
MSVRKKLAAGVVLATEIGAAVSEQEYPFRDIIIAML